MALPFFVQLGLGLIGGAGKQAAGSAPQSQASQVPRSVDVTGNLSSMPAKSPAVVDEYETAAAQLFGFKPASVVTVPGTAGNVAQAAPPQVATPLPGNPNVPTKQQENLKSAWQVAWEGQKAQRTAELEYAKSNPLYGMFYGLGAGFQQRMR